MLTYVISIFWIADGRKRYIDNLLTHKEEIIDDSKRAKGLEIVYSELQQCLGDKVPSQSDVIDIYGKVVINSFTITNNSLNPIGQGVYLGASVLDHSCAPNAIWYFIF